jgi:competence protein ComEC
LRFAITAFIAGGSLLFFLPEVPIYWGPSCFVACLLCMVCAYVSSPTSVLRNLAIIALMFFLVFSWNTHYAQSRLRNIIKLE